jgi:predicted HAD superfamily phosphohydrolase YqeG
MPGDQFATVVQTLPRLWTIARNTTPTYHLDSVNEITADFLKSEGIRGVLWDVDGTIMPYHAKAIDDEFVHLGDLFANGPAKHGILSNCDEVRFLELAEMIPELPNIRGYTTPSGLVFRKTHHGQDTHTPAQVAELLAGGAKQIRKPSGALIRYGMEVLSIDDPHAMLMVGDQHLTDVASANLAGARSAKIRTWRRDTFPASIRFAQVFERALYWVMRPFS